MSYSCTQCSSLDSQDQYKMFNSFHWRISLDSSQSKICRITFVLGRHETRFGCLNHDEKRDLHAACKKVRSVCASSFGATDFTFKKMATPHLCFVLTPFITNKLFEHELVAKKEGGRYKEINMSQEDTQVIRQEIVTVLIHRKYIDEKNLEVMPFCGQVHGVLEQVKKKLLDRSGVNHISRAIFIPSRL